MKKMILIAALTLVLTAAAVPGVGDMIEGY